MRQIHKIYRKNRLPLDQSYLTAENEVSRTDTLAFGSYCSYVARAWRIICAQLTAKFPVMRLFRQMQRRLT